MCAVRLAIDCMGGDYAPSEIVAGAVQGAKEQDLRISLVGDPDAIQRELSSLAAEDMNLEVVSASDVVVMDEKPVQAVREKPDASINVACRYVAEGSADGVLTMGHTGAGLISAMLNFGTIPGVERPAPIVPFLGLRKDLYMLDAGANTEVRPNQLLQFALMGSAYVEHIAGIPSPRVGLLSNGAEPNKGSKTYRAAYPLLAESERLNFYGNIEGHTLFSSDVNVVVCDGFVGNIVFKTAQGIVYRLLDQVEEILTQLSSASAEILRSYLDELREINDYVRPGVAALLGVQHPIFIGHGRSKSEAVRNGIATAYKMISDGVVGKIREAIQSYG
jgi:glycerol-3-phosphate acyltransferase PlsX